MNNEEFVPIKVSNLTDKQLMQQIPLAKREAAEVIYNNTPDNTLEYQDDLIKDDFSKFKLNMESKAE